MLFLGLIITCVALVGIRIHYPVYFFICDSSLPALKHQHCALSVIARPNNLLWCSCGEETMATITYTHGQTVARGTHPTVGLCLVVKRVSERGRRGES